MSFLTGTQSELLYAMPATGGSVTGTVSNATTNLISLQGGATSPAYQLPAYFFPNSGAQGKSLLLQGGGTLLNGPAVQTMRFAVYFDTAIGNLSNLICATGLYQPFTTTVSQTGTFFFEVLITCTSVGTAGTLNVVGRVSTGSGGGNTGTNVGNVTMLMNNSTQPTFNNATAYWIDVLAHFGATTTTQAITLTNFLVWGLN